MNWFEDFELESRRIQFRIDEENVFEFMNEIIEENE